MKKIILILLILIKSQSLFGQREEYENIAKAANDLLDEKLNIQAISKVDSIINKVAKEYSIYDTTYEKLCNELLKDLEKSLPPIIFKYKTKSEVIEIMLTKTFINMVDEGASFLKMAIFEKMPNAPIDEMTSVFENKFEVFLKKHMFIKYKPSKDIYGEKDLDVEKTYRSIIKDMNITATKMKKKIAKLYEDVPYDYEN